MPRHDYQLPPDWESLSDAQKSKWMTQERAKRQHMNQDTPTTHELQRKQERYKRKAQAAGWEMTKHNR